MSEPWIEQPEHYPISEEVDFENDDLDMEQEDDFASLLEREPLTEEEMKAIGEEYEREIARAAKISKFLGDSLHEVIK